MNLVEIIFLSVAMGIDCLVVSFSQGLIFHSQRAKNSFVLALTMGLFQGIMPCIGYLGANSIKTYVAHYSEWLVFSIFMLLGLKFIFEVFSKDEKEEICCIGLKCLVAMGFATSIDALVAGGSLSFSGTPILVPVILIGVMSFVMSLVGFWSGNILKYSNSKYLELAGGLILIGLAIKTIL